MKARINRYIHEIGHCFKVCFIKICSFFKAFMKIVKRVYHFFFDRYYVIESMKGMVRFVAREEEWVNMNMSQREKFIFIRKQQKRCTISCTSINAEHQQIYGDALGISFYAQAIKDMTSSNDILFISLIYLSKRSSYISLGILLGWSKWIVFSITGLY